MKQLARLSNFKQRIKDKEKVKNTLSHFAVASIELLIFWYTGSVAALKLYRSNHDLWLIVIISLTLLAIVIPIAFDRIPRRHRNCASELQADKPENHVISQSEQNSNFRNTTMHNDQITENRDALL